jgi:hypothetical protein
VIVDSRQPIVGTRVSRFDLNRIGSVFQQGASLTLWKVDAPLRLRPVPAPLPPRANDAGVDRSVEPAQRLALTRHLD